MTYIDVHCHLNFPDYERDRKEVIEKMRQDGVVGICVGTDLKTSTESVELASKYDHLYATVGLHPTHDYEKFEDGEYKKLISLGKVVAVGECGLDYFRKEKNEDELERQKNVFKKHAEFAASNDLPLMIHCRPSFGSMDAYEDVLYLLTDYPGVRGNIHFFVGNTEIAQRFLELGFTMSFTGVVTFARDYDEVIKFLPPEKIMVETDSPFVSPLPFRGTRNEPVYVKEVVKKIAEIKNMSLEEVRVETVNNAKRIFSI